MNSRRDFLKISALASTAALMPKFLRGLHQMGPQSDGRKLVIIQFSGGNDGLNTIIPFEDDLYYKNREGIGIAKEDVLKIGDYQGLNPNMKGFRELFDGGHVSILNSVGYPNPNRSHFRSMDIWHSGSDSNEYWHSGWLGRYLDNRCSGCAEPHGIIEIDDTLSLAVKGDELKGLAVQNPQRLHRLTQSPYFNHLSQAYESNGLSTQSELDYLYKTLTETIHSADYLYEKSKIFKSTIAYPASKLGNGLKLVAELMGSGVDTSVFYVSISGFDTHVRQRAQQDRLLGQYSEAVSAFVKDLKERDLLDETLIMTFSEFGRRVSQNASGGTDHGKANNLFLIGGKLERPGLFNPPPNLAKLDDGDLNWEIDFRQVYASILEDWMGVDAETILRRKYKKLRLV